MAPHINKVTKAIEIRQVKVDDGFGEMVPGFRTVFTPKGEAVNVHEALRRQFDRDAKAVQAKIDKK